MKARFLVELFIPEPDSKTLLDITRIEAENMEEDLEERLLEEGYYANVRLLNKREQSQLD